MTHSAFLFQIFNRPEKTQKAFYAISLAKPRRLYVAADGPRAVKIITDYVEGFLHNENQWLSALEFNSRYGDGAREEGNPLYIGLSPKKRVWQ